MYRAFPFSKVSLKKTDQFIIFALQPFQLGNDLVSLADERLQLLPDLLHEDVVLDGHVLEEIN